MLVEKLEIANGGIDLKIGWKMVEFGFNKCILPMTLKIKKVFLISKLN